MIITLVNIIFRSTKSYNIRFLISFWKRNLNAGESFADFTNFVSFLSNNILVKFVFNDNVTRFFIFLKKKYIYIYIKRGRQKKLLSTKLKSDEQISIPLNLTTHHFTCHFYDGFLCSSNTIGTSFDADDVGFVSV